MNDYILAEWKAIVIKSIEDRRNPYPDTWASRVHIRRVLERLPGRKAGDDEEVEDLLTLLDKWERKLIKDGCQSGNGAAC